MKRPVPRALVSLLRSNAHALRRRPSVGRDPVKLGLVASLARPGGNATGFNSFSLETQSKVLSLLRELVPKSVRVGVLVNPTNAVNTEGTLREVREAAPALGLQIQVLNASTIGEITAAFAVACPRAQP